MTFEEMINHIWSEHTKNLEGTADLIPQTIDLMTTGNQVNSLCGLLLHLEGEHLGRWTRVTNFLDLVEKKNLPDLSDDAKDAIKRTRAALSYMEGTTPDLSSFSPSNRLRVLVSIAGILAGRDRTAEASEAFSMVEKMAGMLENSDPAVKALAMTANNTASALEKKSGRSSAESLLMIQTATLAQVMWKRAGGWREHERAEYGLAMAWLSAGDITKAFAHARKGLQIVEQHGNDAMEAFFMQEAFARIHAADSDRAAASRSFGLMNQHLMKISPDNQVWCRDTVKKIATLLEAR